MLDKIKDLGFHYSTIGAIAVSITDMAVPDEKKVLIAETEEKIDEIEQNYKMGFITAEERRRLIIESWIRQLRMLREHCRIAWILLTRSI